MDSELNDQYRKMQGDKSFAEKDLLAGVEKAWVKFKELSCNYIYESYSPGMEGEMERMSCLVELTSARVVELLYVYTGVRNDGLYTALSLIGGGSEEDKNNFIEKIKNRYKIQNDGAYFERNCRMVESLHGEDYELCMVRMKFQNYSG
ncbi:lysozyme inhibitor LprI family protein [Pseudomonas nitroreducens]|uniref:lysozyme inhibitor LprI family protein n=1 Tax=Pseudomonas TaxID=286 RepID=UPI0022847CA3|nr:lysozyme inhibitor LprI family protein [Pseudomonas nitroreducens]